MEEVYSCLIAGCSEANEDSRDLVLAHRCDGRALAVGELVSRTDKDSNASYG